MNTLHIEHHPSSEKLAALGVARWPTWSKEVSVFPWTYTEQEVAYVIEGEVEVVTSEGQSFVFGAGDLVTFPAGLSCTWKVRSPLRKHYHFG